MLEYGKTQASWHGGAIYVLVPGVIDPYATHVLFFIQSCKLCVVLFELSFIIWAILVFKYTVELSLLYINIFFTLVMQRIYWT